MNIKSNNNNDELRELVEKYLSHWKWYIVSVFICTVLAFILLRYSTEEYGIEATIRINTNKADENVIEGYREANQYGNNIDMISQVTDEMEILKSRILLKKVVQDLNLNIQIFGQGKIKASEFYTNPPIAINFLSNDSIINNIDTTLTVHIDSKAKYLLQKEGEKISFGDKVFSSFGDIVITPNVENVNSLINKDFTIKITPIENKISFYKNEILIGSGGDKSSIIKLTLKDPIREKGVAIVNKLIEAYNDAIIENKNKVIEETSDFINKRLLVVSSELSQVDLTAETIKKDNRLTDLGSQSSIYLESERAIESQINTTTTQLQMIDYIDNYLLENNGNGDLIPGNIAFEDNSVNEITKRHNDLVLQRNRILKNSSEINPVIINLDEQISGLKSSLNTSLRNIKSSNNIKLEALNREGSRMSSRIYSAPKKERQFRDLNRQQNIKESLYLYLLQKREEAAIANGVASPNAIIVNSAYASNKPVYPKKLFVLIAALIFGILIPSIIIYIQAFMNNKIHNKNDIKNLTTIPYIGNIPKSKIKESLVKKVDYSPMAEAFRLLRTNIDFMLSNISKEEAKVIFVTSTTSGEGKSHSSINLARSLSYSNKRVLLIETDIRVPKANKYLKVKNKIGLTNYLVNNKLSLKEVITKIDENLDMLTSGTLPPNPAELLMSDKIEVLFKTVKEEYDYVVVDTASIGLVTDTLIIGKYADLFIYVVRANYLDKRHLSIAESAYLEKRLPNMTILLNGVSPKEGYGYGYGYGSDTTKKKKKWKFV